MTKEINQMAVRFRSLADGDDVAFKWESSLDKILTAGNYAVEIEHYGADVGLPIEGCGVEHSIVGTLVVTDSGALDNKQGDRVMGQVLTFTLRESKETSIYTRTYAGGEWGEWCSLARTGMYDEISNADELYSTVSSLVSTTKELEDNLVYGIKQVVDADKVQISTTNEDGSVKDTLEIPAVTIKKAGVMTAADKAKLNNDIPYPQETGTIVTSADKKYIYRGSGDTDVVAGLYWQAWQKTVDLRVKKWGMSTNDEVGVLSMPAATSEKAGVMTAEDKKKLDDNVVALAAAKGEIQRNTNSVTNIFNGTDVVAIAREVYSIQGKEDICVFLKRTTTAHTSIRNGMACIRELGGNVIRNLVEGAFSAGWSDRTGTNHTIDKGIVCIMVTNGYTGIEHKITHVEGHIYYISSLVRSSAQQNGAFIRWLSNGDGSVKYGQDWQRTSLQTRGSASKGAIVIASTVSGTFYATQPLCIDLTEMFGAGNEPTLGECDAIFGNMPALPLGINVAQPAAFKSVGYNQCDVSKALQNKTVANGAISNGKNYLVPMPCVPCKIGTGENNGYVISTGEGDAWSEEAITAVYYTPLNPIEVTGELYLQKLEPQICEQCNSGHNVYVPSCAGWLLIETTSIDKLCAHFAWSGDRLYTDYEPYEESVIELPSIPEMSDSGLIGFSSNSILTQDIIDLDNNKFIKKFDEENLGDLSWRKEVLTWLAYTSGDKKLYTPSNTTAENRGSNIFSQPLYSQEYKVLCTYKETDDTIIVKTDSGDYLAGDMFGRSVENDKIRYKAIATVATSKPYGNIISPSYTSVTSTVAYYGLDTIPCISVSNSGAITIVDDNFKDKTSTEINNYLNGVVAYYELPTPLEYPIAQRKALAYIANDYGTEELVGSAVPLRNNKLFYMRSLVGELRNFLDRLYGAFRTTDACSVADRLVLATLQNEQPA